MRGLVAPDSPTNRLPRSSSCLARVDIPVYTPSDKMGEMGEWISKIEIFCFAACYAITLALEASRLFFRAPIRVAIMVVFTLVGILAHTLYLVSQGIDDARAGLLPLSSWSDWCLIGAWLVAATFVTFTIRRPEGNGGLFLLPLLVALIAASVAFGHAQPFHPKQAVFRWGLVHGTTLLLGTITVVLGFVAGALYLWQAYRLKHKMPTGRGFKLPSLEVLQRLNVRSFYLSSVMLLVGVLSGVLLNLSATQDGRVPWTDPVVITSLVLIVWLAAAMLFELVYRPARQGQKVAYLTLASFVIFGLVMGILLADRNAHEPAPKGGASSSEIREQDSGVALVESAGQAGSLPHGAGGDR